MVCIITNPLTGSLLLGDFLLHSVSRYMFFRRRLGSSSASSAVLHSIMQRCFMVNGFRFMVPSCLILKHFYRDTDIHNKLLLGMVFVMVVVQLVGTGICRLVAALRNPQAH